VYWQAPHSSFYPQSAPLLGSLTRVLDFCRRESEAIVVQEHNAISPNPCPSEVRMDYSNVSNDLEQPGGSSPWASTSPRADRSTFSQPASDIPSSPLPSQHQSPHPQGNGSPSANMFPPVSTDVPSHLTAPTSVDDETNSPDLSEQLQSAQLGDPDYVGDHETNPYPHHQPQQHSAQQQRHGATRHQSGHRSHRPMPAYKLQAKITALERTGRKDPVLRFDVHVRQNFGLMTVSLFAYHLTDKPAKVSHNTIPRRPADSLGVC
jgi:hypothetical protein